MRKVYQINFAKLIGQEGKKDKFCLFTNKKEQNHSISGFLLGKQTYSPRMIILKNMNSNFYTK